MVDNYFFVSRKSNFPKFFIKKEIYFFKKKQGEKKKMNLFNAKLGEKSEKINSILGTMEKKFPLIQKPV